MGTVTASHAPTTDRAPSDPTASPLVEREHEEGLIAAVLDGARIGAGSSLVLTGSAGIGKSALIDRAAVLGSDLVVLRVDGIEAEFSLGYAALHRLVNPFQEAVDDLPDPQRRALRAVLGLDTAEGPARPLLVGLATLTLLTDVARRRPVLVLADDVQWIDDESRDVLAFVARRILADSVGLVLACRSALLPSQLGDLPRREVPGLSDDGARTLVAGLADVALAPDAVAEVVASGAGNPLALTELGPALTGGRRAADASQLVADRVEELFRAEIAALPDTERSLLLVAAADVTGRRSLVEAAAETLGLPVVWPGLAGGRLLRVDAVSLAFRHPLVRSAAIRAATGERRVEVHRALAQAAAVAGEREQALFHRAEAASGHDEGLAADLEEAASRAGRQGRGKAQIDLLERAARVSDGDRARGHRLLRAAFTSATNGTITRSDLLGRAMPLLDEPRLHAQATWLMGISQYGLDRFDEAPRWLVKAAHGLAPHDPALARSALLDCGIALMLHRRPHPSVGPDDLVAAGRSIPAPPADDAGVTDLLLEAVLRHHEGDRAASLGAMKRALAGYLAADVGVTDAIRVSVLVRCLAVELFDDGARRATIEAVLPACRERGVVGPLRTMLWNLSSVEVQAGRFPAAEVLNGEVADIVQMVGHDPGYVDVVTAEVLAWRGVEQDAAATFDRARAYAAGCHAGAFDEIVDLATAVLGNGLGRWEMALPAAARVVRADHIGHAGAALPELVEAAQRSGQREVAATALADLRDRVAVADTPLGRGLLARSEALLAGGSEAEALYTRAVDELATTTAVPELARAHLLHGEWLRRQRRREDARQPLRTAHELFTAMGAHAFAERARSELAATGERARRRAVDTERDLTPREAQVAQLAATGATNREIASTMYVSAATVDYHLRKVFRKLGVASRRELGSALRA